MSWNSWRSTNRWSGTIRCWLRVRATSLNAADWHLMRGLPYLVRIINGLRKPSKATVLGGDIAGQVEAVGKNVTRFRAGDEVFGRTRAAIRPDRRDAVATGGCAEYACVSEDLLVPKPANLTFVLGGPSRRIEQLGYFSM